MKYLVNIHNLENINDLLLADGFIIGNALFSARITNSFEPREINHIIKVAIENKKEVFLNLNKMFYDEDFNELTSFLSQIDINFITGIIASDLGLVKYLIDNNLANKIVWQGETLSTNYFDFNLLSDQAFGSFSAKEITIDDLEEIAKRKKYHLFIVGHGHLNMFYSKRFLISNFKEHYQLDISEKKVGYHLFENRRDDQKYPILEDNSGTHVFRYPVLNSFNYLTQLEPIVDYFYIDSIFKDDNYTKTVLKMYKEGYNEEVTEEIKERYEEVWDDGFYNVKTVYLKEDI